MRGPPLTTLSPYTTLFRSKKHILCEKPIATNVADAKDMIQVCEDEGVKLQIAYPVRFSGPIAELKAMIDNGELGDIVAFRTTNRGQNPGGWFVDEEQSGGGAVLDHTVHMADIMSWYLNEEVTEEIGRASCRESGYCGKWDITA